MLVEVDGELVGFVLFFYNFSMFLVWFGLYLEDLFVWFVYRGCGVGCELFCHFVRVAIQCGCGCMEWVVFDWNELVIRFY